MSSSARYIVLIAGILGVLGMFQPLMKIGRYKLRAELSAYELSFGLSRTHKALDTKLPLIVELKLPPDVREARDDIKTIMDASKNAALAYIPAAVLLLIGAYATWRKRLNRPLAALCILFGLASAAAYIGLKYGIAYGEEEEPILKRVSIELLIGAKILLAGGLAAAIAGLAALVKPN
jgi:hypothetical protein